jgi:8-oxo-dGTP pyrophosphatase MutT (NUDIX family)
LSDEEAYRRPSLTWDGLVIASEPPYGASIVVRRGADYLILQRRGALGRGDWEWTPPSGARQPGESIEDCVIRELVEETGLSDVAPTLVSNAGDWQIWLAQVPADAVITLDREHVDYRWVSLDDALELCRPQTVADGLAMAGRA